MQALKGLVIGLGLIIVLGMGLLVWGLYKKSEDPDFKMFDLSKVIEEAKEPAPTLGAPLAPAAQPMSAPTSAEPWGNVALHLPQGCTIAEMAFDQGRLFLRSSPKGAPVGGCTRVTIIDPATGTIIGTISE